MINIDSEEAIDGDVLIGTFKYNQNNNAKLESVIISILDPNRNIKYESKDESGSFTIDVQRDGIHDICFWNTGRFTRSVTLDLKNALKKKQHEDKIKKKHIEPLQQQMFDLLKAAKHLRNDLEHLKDKEWKMRDLNEKTNARVIWLSFLSIFIFIVAGIAKMFYLKSFFTKKKLI